MKNRVVWPGPKALLTLQKGTWDSTKIHSFHRNTVNKNSKDPGWSAPFSFSLMKKKDTKNI